MTPGSRVTVALPPSWGHSVSGRRVYVPAGVRTATVAEVHPSHLVVVTDGPRGVGNVAQVVRWESVVR